MQSSNEQFGFLLSDIGIVLSAHFVKPEMIVYFLVPSLLNLCVNCRIVRKVALLAAVTLSPVLD